MKRPSTSQEDGPQRNVSRCGPSRHRARDLRRATQTSTAPQVPVHPQSLISDVDEGDAVSVEVPPCASEPLVRSVAPHAGSNIPASEERRSAQRNVSRCGPCRRRARDVHHATRTSPVPQVPVHPRTLISAGDERGAVSAQVPPSVSEPLVGSAVPHSRSHIPYSEEGRISHTVELPEDAQTMAPHPSGELENDYSLSSDGNFWEGLYQSIQVLHQNPQMLNDGEQVYLLIMNELLTEGRLAQGEPIAEVNRGVQTSELSNFIKKVVCCGEQDQDEHCVICLEHYNNGDELGQLKCSHKYHFSCICKWMEQQTVCPLCRRRAAPF